MKFVDMFSRVRSISVSDVLEITENPDLEITLLDVREPGEYRQGHIPGAVLVPLSQLPDSTGQIESTKPVITYCKSGGRSRSAASFLMSRGFDASSMKGGFDEWEGLSSTADVDQGMYIFAGTENAHDLLCLAYGLEEVNRSFYSKLERTSTDSGCREIFRRLAHEEDSHGGEIFAKLRRMMKLDIERAEVDRSCASGYLEGGRSPDEVLQSFSEPAGAAELALMIETDSLDLYLRMLEIVKDDESREIIRSIARRERDHIELVGELFRSYLK